MSAQFKIAKKKVSQTELRKFMNEHKGKLQQNVKKIDSPLAKYLETGQLSCALCQSIVRSEAVWNVHINSKQHKENIALAKKLKEETNNFTVPVKRRAVSPTSDQSNKRVKGILKNATTKQTIPSDFFDSNPSSSNKVNDIKSITKSFLKNKKHVESEEKMEVDKNVSENTEKLPEGFFDDPVMDAKARNQEYKNPIDEEWEKFQREMKEVESTSAAIIAEDQEEATTERQIDEVDEQIRNLSRVVELDRKKQKILSTAREHAMEVKTENSSEEDDSDFDEFLDWRAKKSF